MLERRILLEAWDGELTMDYPGQFQGLLKIEAGESDSKVRCS